jgi:histidine triad (HIT) family protein
MNHNLFFKLFEKPMVQLTVKLNRKILTFARRRLNYRSEKKMSVVCPFCGIASGKAPASIVYEDSAVVVFMDLNPASIGHTLVVPREHWENIYEVPENVLADLFSVVKRVSAAVKKTVGAEGISILQLNGRAAGQMVMHFHVHVIPRFRKDAISKALEAMIGHQGFEKPERRDLDETAQKIRENLQKS